MKKNKSMTATLICALIGLFVLLLFGKRMSPLAISVTGVIMITTLYMINLFSFFSTKDKKEKNEYIKEMINLTVIIIVNFIVFVIFKA